MISKKLIMADMDGTLTPSKAALSREMSEMICAVLSNHYFAVVSGGAYHQFQKQFLSNLSCGDENLKNLFLFPTNGSTCYVYDVEKKDWKRLYNEPLLPEESEKIIKSLNEAIADSGLDLSGPYGEIIENRGSQVTFSARGQQAPMEVKEVWDPDQAKRKVMAALLMAKIPEFEVRIGGVSSIDITRKGIDKAYAVGKIREILKITDEDIIFVGDALYKGGNDEAVKKTDVDFFQTSGPAETLEFLEQYI